MYMARTYICILVVFGTPIFPSYFIILMLSYGIFSPIKYDVVNLCLNAYKQFKHLLLIHLLGFEPFIENFYVYETDQISMKFTQNYSSYFYNYLVVIGFR